MVCASRADEMYFGALDQIPGSHKWEEARVKAAKPARSKKRELSNEPKGSPEDGITKHREMDEH